MEYDGEYGRLYNLGKETLNGTPVSAYTFSYSEDNLEAVVSLDKDSIPVETLSMTYYTSPNGAGTMSDIFGFRKPKSNDSNAPFDPGLDGDFAKIHSLKEIHPADGGKICLDYELNGFPSADESSAYGGIRIKSIVLDNPSENRSDTVSYHYEQALHTFREFPQNYEKEIYNGFTDHITHSKVKSEGHATLSPGNNGLYYPMVRETIAGQGTRWLLFNFTDYGPEFSHSHWLVGLPTLTIEQDEEGNVERILQNLYYTDRENGVDLCLFPESLIHLDAASYDKNLPQMVAHEKYMDLEDIKEEMGIKQGINLGNPVARAFEFNIIPRIRSSYPTVSYSLYYGGATLIAEQREYRPLAGENPNIQTLMEQDPYNRTVYHYGNLQKHTRPTRIVSFDSQGDSTVVHNVYADDMAASASEDIARMQEANIVSPIVKQAMTRNGILQEETVTEYETMEKENGCFYAPQNIYSRKSNQTDAYTATIAGLFQGSVENYQLQKSMVNDTIQGESYLPIEITEEGIRTRFVFDKYYKRPLLQLKNINDQEAWALDCWHYAQISYYGVTDPIARIRELALPFMEGVLQINPEELNLDVYSTYCTEEGMQFMQTLLKNPEGIWMQQEINEAIQLLDTCATLYYFPIEEFLNIHIYLASDYLEEMGLPNPWAMSIDDMAELYFLVMEDLHSGEASLLRNYILSRNGMGDEIHFYAPQTLSVNLESSNLKLYLISTEGDAYIKYTITHNGGTTERTLELSDLTPGKVKDVSLDVNGYSGASGITVTGFGGVQYLAVVPEGTEFVATSYNEDGTVSLKFDPSGHMETYEYDKAGRPILVRDENGKILKGNEYNKKNTNL